MNILLTGGDGLLGSKIISSKLFDSLLHPTKLEMGIIKVGEISKYFTNYSIHGVIHCAAQARMKICQDNPSFAIKSNIIGTANLVNQVLDLNMQQNKN